MYRSEETLRLIESARAYVESSYQGADSTGHDHWHSFRVGRLARMIAREEGVDEDLAELAGVLHDVGDHKFSGSAEAGPAEVRAFLEREGALEEVVEAVERVVRQISFKGALVEERVEDILTLVVMDADRLEAIGAIGIGRAFAYGGHVGRPMHDPRVPVLFAESADGYRGHKGTTLNHFEEKLLLLRDRMNTASGKEMAEARHRFLEDFQQQFMAEWEV